MNPAERTVLKLAAGAVLWIAAMCGLGALAVACSPQDDGTKPEDCGELSNHPHCDGQTAPATPPAGTAPPAVSVSRPVSRAAGRQPLLVQADTDAPSIPAGRDDVEQGIGAGLHGSADPAVSGGAAAARPAAVPIERSEAPTTAWARAAGASSTQGA